jgi:hypothetical protein
MVEQFSDNAVCSVTDGGRFPLPPFVPGTLGDLPAPHFLFFGCHESQFGLVGYGSAFSKNQYAYEYAYQEPRRALGSDRATRRARPGPAELRLRRGSGAAGQGGEASKPMQRRGRELGERAAGQSSSIQYHRSI